eukprot:15442891-Alexandrium_andersonii.AAC.1
MHLIPTPPRQGVAATAAVDARPGSPEAACAARICIIDLAIGRSDLTSGYSRAKGCEPAT